MKTIVDVKYGNLVSDILEHGSFGDALAWINTHSVADDVRETYAESNLRVINLICTPTAPLTRRNYAIVVERIASKVSDMFEVVYSGSKGYAEKRKLLTVSTFRAETTCRKVFFFSKKADYREALRLLAEDDNVYVNMERTNSFC